MNEKGSIDELPTYLNELSLELGRGDLKSSLQEK